MKSYQPLLVESEWKKPDLSASDLTAFALEMLRLKKYRVRRVNNVGAYKKRKNQVEAGWPDIQGYSPNGLATLCEVKKRGDTFTHEQYDRLEDCHACGGDAFVCVDVKGNAQLIKFTDYAKNIKPVNKKR